MIQKAKRERIRKDYFKIGVDSFNRFDVFVDKSESNQTYGELWFAFQEAYTSSDHLYHHKDFVRFLVMENFHPTRRRHMMNRNELKLYNALPDRVTIYRGMSIEELASEDYGVSWTLDKKVDTYFAKDYPRGWAGEATVHSIDVNKNDIIAIFTDRKEQEIIYVGEHL